MWIVDFGRTMSEKEAAFYEGPFTYILEKVEPERAKNRRDTYRLNWWRHMEPRPAMWSTIRLQQHAEDKTLQDCPKRYIATPTIAKHRVLVWLERSVLHHLALSFSVIEDVTTLRILHSRFHEVCSLRLGTSLEDRPRYTPTTTFETFPFPEGLTPNIPSAAYAVDLRAMRIANAAKKLDDLRKAWLNPPDLIRIEPEVVPGYADRILPKDADAAQKLKERTLTNLYNQRPQWLADAHEALDRAVAAAYGWPEDISTELALEKLLALNLARAAAKG
jgi:type II restriction/modification system DNA methylase subunit YeeA